MRSKKKRKLIHVIVTNCFDCPFSYQENDEPDGSLGSEGHRLCRKLGHQHPLLGYYEKEIDPKCPLPDTN